MKKMLSVTSLFSLVVFASGCATVMTGKYQSIPVTSEPPGVKVRADTGETIITPGKFHLIRNEDHTLVAEYPGSEPQQLKLHNKAQGWVWGNILLGGGIGLIVDCVSGASDELIPKEVHFNFEHPELTTREATKLKDTKAGEKASSNNDARGQESGKQKAAPTINNSADVPQRAPSSERIPTDNNALQVIYCSNCGHEIGKLEKAYLYEGHVVCGECFKRLQEQP